MQVEYVKCQPWDDKLSPNGHHQGHDTFYKYFGLVIISFDSMNLGTSNFVC